MPLFRRSNSTSSAPAFAWPSGWHLASLAALAISHPIAAVLVQGPEFLVAYDFDRTRLVLLGVGLFAALPAGVWLIAAAAARLHARAGRWVATTLFALLIALITLQGLRYTSLPEGYTLSLAAVAGLLGAAAYGRIQAFRLFVSMLTPAPLVAAIVFFTSPPVASMMRSVSIPGAAVTANAPSPLVVIVFDQLPLVSLLDDERHIDLRRFPNFAALADQSTWYRNTSAGSTTTNWALPALLTGRYPDPDLQPSAFDHPRSLFTLLSGTHRFHVTETLTALCPPQLCQPDTSHSDGAPWWLAVPSDLAVVYAHIVLPPALAASLPPVNHDWRGFSFHFWQGRWATQRDDDRRRSVLEWIEGIERENEPVLHFLHVLLPHEPFIYLPTGQTGSSSIGLPGLAESENWSDDRRLVALNYQRHLLQVQFVDRLLGLTLDRLKQVGLYDRALIAIVADHGAAFRPERPFRQPVDSTLAEIGAIPFFLKEPGTSSGRIVDAPLEAIDVLPTIAHALGVQIPWGIDGRAAQLPPLPGSDTRRLYRDRAERYVTFSPDDFERAWQAAEQRRREAIDPDPTHLGWRGDPARHLIGMPVRTTQIAGEPRLIATLDGAASFDAIDPNGPYVPVYVSGAAHPRDGSASVQVPLALVVNGVIRATTEPARRPIFGREGFWAALVAPDAYRAGHNEIDVFEIASIAPPILRPVLFDTEQGQPPNLLEREMEVPLGVTQSGFHPAERGDGTFLRWTNGDASLTIPINPRQPPRVLEVTVLMGSGTEQTLEIRANGCLLFSGPPTDEPAKKALDLSSCGDLGSTLTVTFVSDTFVPGPTDSRTLGVAIESVRLRG